MHFFQLAAAWLFPCAVCATLATTATAIATATDGASTADPNSSSSPAFSAGVVKLGADDPGSSPSAFSTTSSSTSSLLDTRTRCGSPKSARSPEKQGGAAAAATPKGDAIRRCLRRLAKKLQRTSGVDEALPDGRRGRKKSRSRKRTDGRGAVVDGTAREREEAVASAIAYCKETMSRRPGGTSPSTPCPVFDGWLLEHPDEIGSACDDDADCKCPALRRDVSLLEWLPGAPARTSSAAVPHHASFDEYGGKSVAETAKRA